MKYILHQLSKLELEDWVSFIAMLVIVIAVFWILGFAAGLIDAQ